MVTPLKSHPQAVTRTTPEWYCGGDQATVMAKKKVKIDHFLMFLPKKILVKMLFLELFCNVLHHERPHFDLAVLLRRFSATICGQYVR